MRLIIPEEGMKKIRSLGLKARQIRNLRREGDALVFANKSRLLASEFSELNKNFGAVIVCEDKAEVEVLLSLHHDHPGVIDGVTASEYAKDRGVSRQRICKLLSKGRRCGHE